MPAKINVSSNQIRVMRLIYETGEGSTRDIASRFGMSYGTVRSLLIGAGVVLSRGPANISRKMRGRVGSRRGVTQSAESIEKQKKTRLEGGKPYRSGYAHSDETRRKISEAVRAVTTRMPEEHRKERERVRQAAKRFVRRVLNAKGVRKEGTSASYLGYGTDELWKHLGARHGTCDIDHIVPVAAFMDMGIFNVAIINALPNLRWLESRANKQKSDRLPPNARLVLEECIQFAKSRGLA